MAFQTQTAKNEQLKDHNRDKIGIPIMNAKGVDKPVKYDGAQFRLWYKTYHIEVCYVMMAQS